MDFKNQHMKVTEQSKPKGYYLEMPNQVVESLNLQEDQEITLKIEEDRAILKKDLNERLISIPLKPVIIASLVAVVTFLILFFNYQQIPLVGAQSTASIVILLGGLTGMINFTIFFTKSKRGRVDSLAHKIYWRNFPTVLLSYTLLVFVSLLFFFRILGHLFVGATFDTWTSTVIGTLLVAIINYIMVYAAKTLTPVTLIKSLTYIIIGGVTVAMLTNQDQQWWLDNLSFLGTPEAINSWQFNITLMFSALIMIALIDYLFVMLYEGQGKSKNLIILKALLILMALLLGGVGLFPYDDSLFNQTMHNRVAEGLIYIFIVLIIGIRWLLPKVTKQFLKISYGVGAALIGSVFLFQGIHYLSLTAFELISFVLAFSWLLLLLQNLVNIVMNQGQEFTVALVRPSQTYYDLTK